MIQAESVTQLLVHLSTLKYHLDTLYQVAYVCVILCNCNVIRNVLHVCVLVG